MSGRILHVRSNLMERSYLCRGVLRKPCHAFQMVQSYLWLLNMTSPTHSLTYTLCSQLRSYIPVRHLPASCVCTPFSYSIQWPFWYEHHIASWRREFVRCLSKASVILKTDNDVVRFCIDRPSVGISARQTMGSNKNGTQMKGMKTCKRVKKSKRAKVNELKFYRLMARKKMRSPNPEVRIRYKLEKVKRKEAWLIEKLVKFEVPKPPPETYDPEILTEEEKFYLKRTGEKKKNYVPVGRRGVFGGVVLNMHLHWKRHETVKVVCKPCKPGQVNEYAEEIARLSKGIAIDIKADNTIIFYRGKNYAQPEVMSPPDTLSKNKALEKYKYEQSLEHTSQFIEKLEKELEEYHKHISRYRTGKEAVREDSPSKV